jgi:hypothetical protein
MRISSTSLPPRVPPSSGGVAQIREAQPGARQFDPLEMPGNDSRPSADPSIRGEPPGVTRLFSMPAGRSRAVQVGALDIPSVRFYAAGLYA